MRAPEPELVVRLRAAGCVFAEEEAALLLEAATDPVDLERLVVARAGGAPLESLLGWCDFAGVRVRVDRGVFVPRQRTALLADLAVRAVHALAASGRPGGLPLLVDLCCGTGALGAAVLARVDVEVHAADLDPAAVENARRNLAPERVYRGDLYSALPPDLAGRVDVLMANAPYVPTDHLSRLPPEARDHEHPLALDGGRDGLDVHRRVAADAARWLAPGGVLLIEVATGQVPLAVGLLRAGGLVPDVVTDDDRGATAVRGRLLP